MCSNPKVKNIQNSDMYRLVDFRSDKVIKTRGFSAVLPCLSLQKNLPTPIAHNPWVVEKCKKLTKV
jgi:hypothetical protein